MLTLYILAPLAAFLVYAWLCNRTGNYDRRGQMKIKNLVVRSDDQGKLDRLRDEYRDYCGFDCQLRLGKLTVFAVPRSARKAKRSKAKDNTGAL